MIFKIFSSRKILYIDALSDFSKIKMKLAAEKKDHMSLRSKQFQERRNTQMESKHAILFIIIVIFYHYDEVGRMTLKF